jgi:hypothetical protein
MMTQKQQIAVARGACSDIDPDLEVRVRREFSETPGLRLTLRQAGRLFNVPPATCEAVLHRLVRVGDLRICGTMFVRADSEGQVR